MTERAPHVVANGPGPRSTSPGEMAALFLRLGTTAFGGPAAHLAMMREEVVTRRRRIDDADSFDLLGAAGPR